MTKDEVNRTIHEAMGLCVHKNIIHVGKGRMACKDCVNIGRTLRVPDYHTTDGFFTCWDWAKEQDFWDDFEVWYWNMLRNTGIMDYDFRMSDYLKHLINTETFAPRLAMFIKRKNK